jgi:hypothetical protein
MANKKNQPQRRSLSSRIDAAIADNENTQVAGITQEQAAEKTPSSIVSGESIIAGPKTVGQGSTILRTKKATTIMPKEVFNALQRYCTEGDIPKHRAIYLFILDGLHDATAISDEEYQRFRDMAVMLTTTYEKK